MTRRILVLLALISCRTGERSRLPPLADTAAYREARLLVSSGRFPAAALAFARIRDSFAQTGDQHNAWYGQLWWAETMTRAGQPDSANRGLVIAREMANGEPRWVGWVEVMESHSLERRGKLDSAIAAAEHAIERYRATGDNELGVFAYDALGTPLSRRGRYRDALVADSTSLALRQAIPLSPRVIASGWNEVAIGYRHLARFDEAAAALGRSHDLAESQHDTLAMALALANLANVRNDTGDRDAAIATLLEATDAFEAIKHRRLMNESYNDLAALYLDAGKPGMAASPAARALEGSRAMTNRSIEISALEMLGRVALANGRLPAARDSLSRGLALADQLGFGAERVSARIGLVDVSLAANQAVQARRFAEEALRIADSLGDPAIQFNAMEARARALEVMRDPAAIPAFEAALDLLESIRGRLALGDLRMGVTAPRVGVYEGAILARLARHQPLEAFAVAERARGRLLLELIADRGIRSGGTSLDSLRQRLREAFDGRANVRDPAAGATLDRAIAALSDSLRAFESNDFLAAGKPIDADHIRQRLLPGDRGLLAWFWGEKQVIGWWITQRDVRAVALGPSDSLAATVEFLADAIAQPGTDTLWRSAARKLHEALVAPLVPAIGAAVILLPDGPLHRIPVELILGEALPPTSRVSYGPSASVLSNLAERPAGQWARQMLVVGNPASSAGLGALPFAEREARAVQELFRAEGSVALLGTRATTSRWLSYRPGQYRYLHFAVHAMANDRQPEKTALVFADGSLLVPAIRHLRLSAELVSLSACETAAGRWVRGEGVIGLPFAFLAAGARGALVTFWRVPDRAAADFSEAFYREIRAGHTPADALARVKAAWRRASDDRAHPSRWAAFAFIGVPA